MTGLVMIPARRASTRLADKLLLAETGRPLLAHVIDVALAAVDRSGGLLVGCVVACDDVALARVAHDAGVGAVMTGPEHPNGSSRLAEAVGRYQPAAACDFVVNLQGDEPDLHPDAVVQVARTLAAGAAPMATLAVPITVADAARRDDPSVVKVLRTPAGDALWFTRAAVPHYRGGLPADPEAVVGHQHLGLYAYRTSFLLALAGLAPTPAEQAESLEQLRVLEHGHAIGLAIAPPEHAGRGIDTRADYDAFVSRWRRAA